ncbi:MAG: hypothetical protein J7K89_05970 [Candidatus Cloacimonetes bacterium]|nr:hypothetical protein [Candidatus Cloacimonadota bacterium]
MLLKQIVEYHLPALYMQLIKMKNCINGTRINTTYKTDNGVVNIPSPSHRNTFFGYYDKTPFNPEDENLLVFHANNQNPQKKPSCKTITDILLHNRGKNSYSIIGKTTAWNWQQGARLHWIDSSHIVYNCYDKEKQLPRCKRVNVFNLEEKTYDYPLQESFSNKFFLSLDYSTLNKTRPDYGYRNSVRKNNYTDNSVFMVSYKNGKSEKLFDISDILNLLGLGNIQLRKSKARINHIMVTPDGEKFIFLFRYIHKYKLQHILMMYDCKNSSLKVLLKDNMISHYCWIDNDNILFWGIVNSIGDYYRLNTDIPEKAVSLKTGMTDGHPWLYNDNTVISDTYPDNTRHRKLIRIDLDKLSVTELLRSYESCKFIGETRCDLHPHPSPSGKWIHYDSINTGQRLLSLYEVNDDS